MNDIHEYALGLISKAVECGDISNIELYNENGDKLYIYDFWITEHGVEVEMRVDYEDLGDLSTGLKEIAVRLKHIDN